MQIILSLYWLLGLVLVCQSYGKKNRVCLSIPSGPAGPTGPPGPAGLPGMASECLCNQTKIKEEMKSQKDAIQRLTDEVDDLKTRESIIRLANETTNLTEILINSKEIREIFKEERRKKHNCPIGLADGRIPDDAITSSSIYNNESMNAPKWARLNDQPFEVAVRPGAWMAQRINPILNLTCHDSFYPGSSYGYNYQPWNHRSFSTKLSRDLVQTVRCPRNCRSHSSSSVTVLGKSRYADGSTICGAAIHNGKITDEGGLVTVKRQPRRIFNGSERNHLRSRSYTSIEGTFHFLSKHLLEWIQVDFKTSKLLTGVVTQGRPTLNKEWVQSFIIQYGSSETLLQAINYTGTDTVFLANNDAHSHVTNMFREPIRARYVRLLPLTWKNKIALRLEYLTC